MNEQFVAICSVYPLTCLSFQACRGPWFGLYWQLTPSGIRNPSARICSYLSLGHLVNPHFLEMTINWRPGNLNLDRLKASMTWASFWSRTRQDMIGCPMCTRATVPWALPKAPLIPVWSLSAPAHDNILLILLTWKGWHRTRKWKASFPQFLTRYLLAQIRPASRASEDSCSYSLEIMWMHSGKSSTRAFFLPKSKILIFGSGTPRQKRDFGYGLFLQYL